MSEKITLSLPQKKLIHHGTFETKFYIATLAEKLLDYVIILVPGFQKSIKSMNR